MPVLKNQRHEAFAQRIALLDCAVDAYRKAFKCTQKVAESNSSRLREKAVITARISELQKLSESKTVLTMQERREFLARVVRARLGDIDLSKDGDLIQEIIDTEDGRKIKLPGKRECIMDDAKLAGELTDKLEVKDVTEREPLSVIRERIAKSSGKLSG